MLNQYASVEEAIKRLEAKIRQEVQESNAPFVQEAVKLLDPIPGVAETAAQIIVLEIGVDMNQFASDKQLASRAGMCPGNNESAGKRRSGKTRKGNRYLRAVLVQKASYQELGGDYFDRRHKEQQKKRLIKQLESLGLKVTVEELERAA